jgi:phage-related protein
MYAYHVKNLKTKIQNMLASLFIFKNDPERLINTLVLNQAKYYSININHMKFKHKLKLYGMAYKMSIMRCYLDPVTKMDEVKTNTYVTYDHSNVF